jgi:hypothetical protein
MGYLDGRFPPGEHDVTRREAANGTFIEAHRRAVEIVRAAGVQAGLTLAMREWVALEGGEDSVAALQGPYEDVFLEAARGDDFIGVQTYTRNRVGPAGQLGPEEGMETTLMGYDVEPGGKPETFRCWSPRTALPRQMTAGGLNSFGELCSASAGPSMMESMCAPTRIGARSTISSGRSATGRLLD